MRSALLVLLLLAGCAGPGERHGISCPPGRTLHVDVWAGRALFDCGGPP